MCVGIMPVLGIAMAVGQAAMGYSAAQAEYKANEQTYENNLENAKTASQDRYASINSRVMQEHAAATQDLQETSIEALRARASMRVAAQEGGVSGNSVDAILREAAGKEARYAANTQQNFDYQRDYWAGEGKATAASSQSQVNSVQRTAKPSFLPFAMQAFGSALDTYRTSTA
jgi:hypothetical protein